MKIPHESQQLTFKREYNSLLLQEILCFRLNNKVYHKTPTVVWLIMD